MKYDNDTTNLVRFVYLDTRNVIVDTHGNISFENACLSYERHCQTLAEAKQYIIDIRKRAASKQYIALVSIALYETVHGEPIPFSIWSWNASTN